MYHNIKKIVKNPYIVFSYLGKKGYLNWLSDKLYLKIIYKARMNRTLNLKNPVTFNEKLQWLKLYDRNSAYTSMVDKYEVRNYIQNKIGIDYLIPLIGEWDNFDEIDFKKLPDQFVLKTTHDSGGVVICKDKSKFDIDGARNKINKSLKKIIIYILGNGPIKILGLELYVKSIWLMNLELN